jgi:hypothetical protein
LDTSAVQNIARAKRAQPEWEVAVERPTYDLTIFKLHCSGLTLKIYSKGERVLRIEVIVHDTRELGCGRALENFPEIVRRLQALLVGPYCVNVCWPSAARALRPSRGAHNPTLLDAHYDALRAAMRGVFHELGIAA